MELYGLVRRAVMLEGLSHRAAARRFGIDRGTVPKMIGSPAPPGYQRKIPIRRPKLADHEGFIEQILDEDEKARAKQRHTARRIFERLRDERGFDGAYSTVRDYVRSRRQVRKEVFVPLAHPPGRAPADFGEARPRSLFTRRVHCRHAALPWLTHCAHEGITVRNCPEARSNWGIRVDWPVSGDETFQDVASDLPQFIEEIYAETHLHLALNHLSPARHEEVNRPALDMIAA